MAVLDVPLNPMPGPSGALTAPPSGVLGRSTPEGGSARSQDQPGHPGGAAKAVFGVLGLVLLVYAASLILRKTGATTRLVDGWGVATFELLVSGLVVIRAVTVRGDRAYGWWLGLGMFSWALGDVVMTLETAGGATPATLSPANILWYGFFPLTYVGVMVLMRRDVRKFTVANYLDGVVACLVTAALFAAFAFTAIVKLSGAGSASTAVNIVYPVGDLLLLALVIISLVLLPAGKRARWYLIAGACVVNAFGDVSVLFPGVVATHAGFLFNSVAWPASLWLIAAAAWLTPAPSGVAREEKASGFVIPAVAAGLALIILFVGSLNHTSQVALGLATVTLIAAGVRFAIAMLRLRALTEERHQQLVDAAGAERESREALQATVREYSDFAGRVADGDLTAVVASDRSEELRGLAESLNRMVSGLAEISGEIQGGVQNMGSSTAAILEVVSLQTESASRQSAAIEDTSSTVNELRVSADKTAKKAGEVAERARDSVQVSDAGTAAVEAIASSMEEIRARVDGIARDIETLSARASQISEITDTVNGLADRSNLLALNASIEAARAGEHGRGFAVVADQVRRLADQSKEATAQVELILKEVQTATSAAVLATEQGAEVVEQGLGLTERARDGIRSLTDTIGEASRSAEEIAASAHQQSVGMDQIASAMHSINEGTAQFVAGAEQSQQAAEVLDELSGKLSALAKRYRV
jgi:methyl-accepting chemotaxis protein